MNVFPHSKIKAQLLQDENVGRVSSKAIDLIAACSALFVRDLVAPEDDGDSCSGSTRRGLATSATVISSSSSRGGNNNVSNDDDDIRGGVKKNRVDLDCIKRNIRRRSEYFNFLDGELDELTEENAPNYDAAAKKRKRRTERLESTNRLPKGQSSANSSDGRKNNIVSKTDDVYSGANANAITTSFASNDVELPGGVPALSREEKEAIAEAVMTTVNNATKEIIQDEDDYD